MFLNINLHDQFNSKTLSYRENCSLIFDRLNKTRSFIVFINFKNINYISRSFVDEYLRLKDKNKFKFIIAYNIRPEIKKIFDAVKKTRQHYNSKPQMSFNKVTFL